VRLPRRQKAPRNNMHIITYSLATLLAQVQWVWSQP